MMFNRQFARARKAFADQFEEDESGIVYRRSQRGLPVRVSAAERDSEVEAFILRIRRASWIMFAGMLLTAVGFAGISVAMETEVSTSWTYVGIGVVVAVYAFLWHRAWIAPSLLFERRPAVGLERSKAEARRVALKKTSWAQFGWSAVAFAWIVGTQALKHDIMHGWNRLWLVGGAVALAAVCWRAAQKWRSERAR